MLRVAELFAGVGGFRIGLENSGGFEIVWSNQYEPMTPKSQHASWVYEARFNSGVHISRDIHDIPTSDIPDIDVLVGGFPCQDYSVASTLKNSKGLRGKKGVLFWQIERILREKKQPPKYLVLENVDRLLKSPANQRGRDLAIMLKSLADLGYAIEWRVINAAEYGFPQKRSRVFILGYHESSPIYNRIKEDTTSWLDLYGTLANAFPIKEIESSKINQIELPDSILNVSNSFGVGKKMSPFLNTGICVDNKIYTTKSIPLYNGEKKVLRDVLEKKKVADEFYLNEEDLPKWKYVKGAKKEPRIASTGYEYMFAEGKMSFPDSRNKPSRTIITGEGGKTPSRIKHVVNTRLGYRRLTPVELERLNGFPDNHTKLVGISNSKRAFFMGNALVCGVIERIGRSLNDLLEIQD